MAATKKPATRKKPTTKKTTGAKAAPARAPKKTTTTRVSTKRAPKMESFKVAKPDQQFMTFRITRQTVYWLILSAVVLALGFWVIDLNNKVQAIYDQIDESNAQQVLLDQKELQLLREKHQKDQ